MKRRGVVLLVLPVCICYAQSKPLVRPVRRAWRGTHGAVAAGSDPAVDAGMRLFHAGGNAVDAGIATMLAASVFEFSHFGLGGEAPILVRTRDGKVHAIAGVGTMPKLATAKFFRERRLMPGEVLEPFEPGGLKGVVPVAGLMPALVPGMVEAALVTLREYGTKSFAEVVQPAVELADGVPLDEMRSSAIQDCRRWFDLWPTSARVFLPRGHVPQPGEVFRQPDLARTLRLMIDAEKHALASGLARAAAIDAVRDYFYRGDIARRIDRFSRAHHGLLRYEDMAAFRLEPEDPVSTTYRGYEVFKPGFWSQGPAMIEALNILEGFDLPAMGWNGARYIHTLVEALKLAYADRDTYYGDPKFVTVPVARLLAKDYAAARRRLIADEASLVFRPGEIGEHRPPHPSATTTARVAIDPVLMAHDTTCIDAMDRDGIVFSSTPSGSWLPSVIAGDTGIPLTERAQSFLLIEGHPNELAGGKRPRVTLSPTLVTAGGHPLLALSTPGGDNQEQSLVQVLFNLLAFGMNAQEAVEAPRFQTRHLVSSFDNHAMNPGDLLLDERTPAAVAAELAARKHHVSRRSRFASGAAPVVIRLLPGGVIEAGADPYGYRTARAW
jgi:gamma-glutamyltranspeptidase/glutathione hydrolase